jgi:Arc/MetJ-type ribon-helix-helix transcriptional regulator
MPTEKVGITLERETLAEVDRWVKGGRFPSRSRAVQTALAEMVARHKRRRLSEELRKLDCAQEQALADEALTGETPWPEY